MTSSNFYSFGFKEPRTNDQCTSLADAQVSKKHNVAFKEVSRSEAQDLYCQNYEIALNTTGTIDTFWQPAKFRIADAIRDAKKHNRPQMLFKDICELLFSTLPQAGGRHYFVLLPVEPKK